MDQVPLQQIYDKRFTAKDVKVFMLRLDLVHDRLHGNKWYKLKYKLERARSEGKNALLTFGGAYSNHIYAAAAAGKAYGFRTFGIIRGEQVLPLNPTLQFASACGMKLFYVNRETYRDKVKCLEEWKKANPGETVHVIPEGGANTDGIKGCMEIAGAIEMDFSRIVCACGTGATLAGISLSLKEGQEAIGIPVLKGGEFLETEIRKWTDRSNWRLFTGYHFGGYAKTTPALTRFIADFEKQHGIKLDPVYTGKMMYALMDLADKGYFHHGETIVALHTGGLQCTQQ